MPKLYFVTLWPPFVWIRKDKNKRKKLSKYLLIDIVEFKNKWSFLPLVSKLDWQINSEKKPGGW